MKLMQMKQLGQVPDVESRTSSGSLSSLSMEALGDRGGHAS